MDADARDHAVVTGQGPSELRGCCKMAADGTVFGGRRNAPPHCHYD